MLAPAAPSKLAAMVVNASTINLSWTDNATLIPPEDGFKIYDSSDGVNSRINLSWTDNATTEDGFKLYRSTDGTNWTWFATAGANVTTYTWWGASAGTTYYFRVTAYNSTGDSDPSNTASAATPAA